VDRIREIMPECSISGDIIAGFCSENEQDQQDTIDIMKYSQYDFGYMYLYSERPGTLAQKRYTDDIPDDIKLSRLQEIIETQNSMSLGIFKKDIGKVHKVLIDGNSKKNEADWKGRNSQNKTVVFPKLENKHSIGDYVHVKIESCTQGTLLGNIVMPRRINKQNQK